MTPETRVALEALLPPGDRGRGEEADLVDAAREAERRREAYERAAEEAARVGELNARQAGAVIVALRELDPVRWSWRKLEAETGIPQATARRWARLAKYGDHDPARDDQADQD